jgi:hypothetical protein
MSWTKLLANNTVTALPPIPPLPRYLPISMAAASSETCPNTSLQAA